MTGVALEAPGESKVYLQLGVQIGCASTTFLITRFSIGDAIFA